MEKISLPEDFNGVHFHFVGIKGTGMVALVEILHARGAVITGSDVSERFYTDEVLEKLSIHALPFSEENITPSVKFVVYSSAYSDKTNPDLIKAKELGLPLLLYSEALGAISEKSYSAGICGVHGKTTTTGLTGTLLKELNLQSQVLAGSIIKSFGESCTMTSDALKNAEKDSRKYFVAETCEYQRHFMAFDPKKIILTSVESDHQDYYPTYEDIRNAFVDYICKLPENGEVIYCADDKGACETVALATKKRNDLKLIPYGLDCNGDYKITLGKVENGVQYFSLQGSGQWALKVPGVHNVKNSAAAVALCVCLLKEDGKDPLDYIETMKNGLLKFAGGKRRSEIVGEAKTPAGENILFLDDYGHHPTAIKTTLDGYRKFYSNHKIIVDFMSHTYTRTQALLEEFASSFDGADVVILNKIYGSAREDASAANVTGKTLYEHALKYYSNVVYCEEFSEAADFAFEEIRKPSGKSDGYLFVTMGAGDNWKVGKLLLEKL